MEDSFANVCVVITVVSSTWPERLGSSICLVSKVQCAVTTIVGSRKWCSCEMQPLNRLDLISTRWIYYALTKMGIYLFRTGQTCCRLAFMAWELASGERGAWGSHRQRDLNEHPASATGFHSHFCSCTALRHMNIDTILSHDSATVWYAYVQKLDGCKSWAMMRRKWDSW